MAKKGQNKANPKKNKAISLSSDLNARIKECADILELSFSAYIGMVMKKETDSVLGLKTKKLNDLFTVLPPQYPIVTYSNPEEQTVSCNADVDIPKLTTETSAYTGTDDEALKVKPEETKEEIKEETKDGF
jgi:hypothetical protein